MIIKRCRRWFPRLFASSGACRTRRGSICLGHWKLTINSALC